MPCATMATGEQWEAVGYKHVLLWGVRDEGCGPRRKPMRRRTSNRMASPGFFLVRALPYGGGGWVGGSQAILGGFGWPSIQNFISPGEKF